MALDLSAYRDPLRALRGLSPERVDQGVDYSGTGPVYALGNGVVTNLYNPGWPGGGFISYRLTDGPYRGQYVYVAEDVSPRVKTGQRVTSDTVIGVVHSGPDGIETGWAAAPGSGDTLASKLGEQAPGSDPGAWTAGAGADFNDLLSKLGAPPGQETATIHGTTTLPDPGKPGKPSSSADQAAGGWGSDLGIIQNIPIIGPVLAGGADVAHGLAAIAAAIAKFEHVVLYWFSPSGLVRLVCLFTGAGFVGFGLVSIARTGRPGQISVPGAGAIPAPGGQLAPALGIAEVTIGAMLLFVAFHNIPAANVGELLTWFQDQLSGQPFTPEQSGATP